MSYNIYNNTSIHLYCSFNLPNHLQSIKHKTMCSKIHKLFTFHKWYLYNVPQIPCFVQTLHPRDHEHVDVPLKTNYLGLESSRPHLSLTICAGYVSWGEYPMNFAAVLNQEEIYRLILAKGGNFDLQVTLSPWLTWV